MKRFLAIFAAVLIGAAAPAAVAQAQGRGLVACAQGGSGGLCLERVRHQEGWGPRTADDARDGVRGGRLVPLEQVIRNIARSTPGRLLDAGIEGGGDRPVYRVRWQTNDGRRIDFIVDARSGQIIGRD